VAASFIKTRPMNNQQGWIKLHRQILEWEWYSDNNCFRLFLHLLLKANHKEKRFKGIELKVGSIVTSRDLLARETGLSSQQIRTALTKLISTNEITSVTSSQGTIIQIVSYEKYQVPTNEITNEQPTSNQQSTTNNNVKKEKKFIIPTFNDVLEYCMQNNLDVDGVKFINFYESKGWMVGKNKMKDWKAAIRTWVKPKQQVEISPEELKAIKLGFLKPKQ
jgi:hypothetical protein